jgi:chromosome segregation ATPase
MKVTLTVLVATIAAISFLFLPACALRKEAPDPVKVQEEIAEYRNQELELIRSTVPDQERVDRLIQLLGERDRLLSDHTKEISAYREQMSALNADYNAERESFDVLMANYNSQRAAAQDEIVGLLAAIKNETTAEEWKVISKFQLKRLHPRELTYGPASGGI